MPLTDSQISQALKKVPKSRKNSYSPPAFQYDAVGLDDLIAGMFGRRWGGEEVFPPRATEIWSMLFRPQLGGSYDATEIEMLLSILDSTLNDQIRAKTCTALYSCLADCSGETQSFKPQIQQALNSIHKGSELLTQNIRIPNAFRTHDDSEENTPPSTPAQPTPGFRGDAAFEAFHGFEPYEDEGIE